MKKALFLLSSSVLLSSCAAVLVLGAAAGLVVYDKRSFRVIEKDARIFHLVHTAIVRDKNFSNSHIDVNSFNQSVLLVGETPSASLRVRAEKIARQTPHVRRVYDEITIATPISISQKASDSWITGEVKSKMLARKGLASGSINVVTENSVVYLMGVVNRQQSHIAVDVARNVKGVKKVVKVFEYRK